MRGPQSLIAETFWRLEPSLLVRNFRYQFAYPLLQVRGRIFTCTTTPPPPDNYFAEFARRVQKQNEAGDTFFYLVNHSLACSECAAADKHHECTHQLQLIPPWKSLLRMTHMESLVPSGQKKTFQAEVYGVCHKQDGTYFDAKLLAAFVERERGLVDELQGNVVYVTVDPASHQKSEMGLMATGLTPTGQTIILGLSAVNVSRYETVHVSAVVQRFVNGVFGVLKRLAAPYLRVVPIVECNNNDVIALSIVNAVLMACSRSRRFRCVNPFEAEHFSKNITPGIGVWTTDQTKLAGIQHLQGMLQNGQLIASATLATVSRADVASGKRRSVMAGNFDGRAAGDVAIATLQEQLGRIKDDPKKKTISGKTAHGDNDDVAIALILAVYWSEAIRICGALD